LPAHTRVVHRRSHCHQELRGESASILTGKALVVGTSGIRIAIFQGEIFFSIWSIEVVRICKGSEPGPSQASSKFQHESWRNLCTNLELRYQHWPSRWSCHARIESERGMLARRRRRRSAAAACFWPSRGSAKPRVGVDGRILRLGRWQLGVAAGAMGAATSSGLCLAGTELRAARQRLSREPRTLGIPLTCLRAL
jgi:hypothetical protein